MMNTEIATRPNGQISQQPNDAVLEKVLAMGDLSKLTATERLSYLNAVCNSLGLNPLTRPLEFISLNGKLTLYARKDCTEQLRRRDKVSIVGLQREVVEGVYVVTARAQTDDGRTDESVGAVSIETLKGEARANAMMKAETKAKRRVTLSICGLGFLDETEIETIPNARTVLPTPPTPSYREDVHTPADAIEAEYEAHVAEQVMHEQDDSAFTAGEPLTDKQKKMIWAIGCELYGRESADAELHRELASIGGPSHITELSKKGAGLFIDHLQTLKG